MTEKQKRFCDEYIKDLNGSRAYKAAYPNVKKDMVAASAATRLLKNVKVKKYIEDHLELIHIQNTAEAAEVLEYLTAVIRGKTQSEIVVVEFISKGVSKARKIMKAPDEKEKLKAAELIGKYYGLYTDKVDLSGSAPVIIYGEDDITD